MRERKVKEKEVLKGDDRSNERDSHQKSENYTQTKGKDELAETKRKRENEKKMEECLLKSQSSGY